MSAPPARTGARNPAALLPADDVRWLRLEYPWMARGRMTHEDIGAMLGISASAVGRILRGETYPDVVVTEEDRERWARERPDVRWEGTSRLYDPDHLPPPLPGEESPASKLPEEAVRWIDAAGAQLREFYGWTLRDLAHLIEQVWDVRVTEVCVGDVLRGGTWTTVTGRRLS